MPGLLVCFEGLDNTGKTTLITHLSEILSLDEIPVIVFSFPNKQTITWRLLDTYQREFFDLDPRAAHLLYSANRWEVQSTIKDHLSKGYVCIVDRYFYSGIAYSCGYHNVDFTWAMTSESGMVLPDLIFYIQASEEVRLARYADTDVLQRYDTLDVQRQVEQVYRRLIEPSWVLINGNDPVDASVDRILDALKPLVLNM